MNAKEAREEADKTNGTIQFLMPMAEIKEAVQKGLYECEFMLDDGQEDLTEEQKIKLREMGYALGDRHLHLIEGGSEEYWTITIKW